MVSICMYINISYVVYNAFKAGMMYIRYVCV